METDGRQAKPGGRGIEGEDNVVRLPRDWLGPREDLIPFGPSAEAHDETLATPPSTHDFWGEGAADPWELEPDGAVADPPRPSRWRVPKVIVPNVMSHTYVRARLHGRGAGLTVLAAVCVAAIIALYRPLLLSSVMPELAEARGVRPARVETLFLVVVALATSMTLPVVGALLIFSLMIGPPAAARSVTSKPLPALVLSAVIAVLVVWASIAAAYDTNWPVGFFVGTFGAVCYAAGRSWAALRGRRAAHPGGWHGAGDHGAGGHGVPAANVRV